MKEPSKEWIEDCMQWRGEVLTGKYAHWCEEWDELPVDETCEEFACCLCYSGPEFEKAKEKMAAKVFSNMIPTLIKEGHIH